MGYDGVIVGGGSAGCVLAARLSEAGDRRVLLLEAGPAYATQDDTPSDLLDASFAPASHDWGYRSVADPSGQTVALPRGKVIGGSSAINCCFAFRGRPEDHDGWSRLGNEGWSYEELLPSYRRFERDDHGEERWHGRSGPYRITRHDLERVAPHAKAAGAAAARLGHRLVDDLNAPGPERVGFGSAPLGVVDGVRQNAALAFLGPAGRRDNLEVRGDAEVHRVLIEDGRAVGVELATGGQILADEVILSAGVYNSPALLMRSGVGPADHLREYGIDVLVDAPGVGRGLTEHPVMWMIFAAHPPEDGVVSTMFQTALSVRSGTDEPDYDLHLLPTAAVPTERLPEAFVPQVREHPTGWDFVLFVSCVQPRSRGSVRLADRDPSVPPEIDLGIYADTRDAEQVARAARIGRELARTAPLADLLLEERVPGPGCRVHGVDGLSVVDASVMPTIPRVAVNLPTLAIAEHVAGWRTAHRRDPEHRRTPRTVGSGAKTG